MGNILFHKKLNNELAKEIYIKFYRDNILHKILSKEYGVGMSTIRSILNRSTYSIATKEISSLYYFIPIKYISSDIEVWKELRIKGIIYFVSDRGFVKNKYDEFINFYEENGYLRCHLGFSYSLHRIVAKAFCPNPLKLNEVHHIDNNKLNNRAENLVWCTSSYNIREMIKNGRNIKCGEKTRSSKLKDQQIIEMRKLYKEQNINHRTLAKLFNTSNTNAYHIVIGKTWKHLLNT